MRTGKLTLTPLPTGCRFPKRTGTQSLQAIRIVRMVQLLGAPKCKVGADASNLCIKTFRPIDRPIGLKRPHQAPEEEFLSRRVEVHRDLHVQRIRPELEHADRFRLVVV